MLQEQLDAINQEIRFFDKSFIFFFLWIPVNSNFFL
jgi:hypothetical protein